MLSRVICEGWRWSSRHLESTPAPDRQQEARLCGRRHRVEADDLACGRERGSGGAAGGGAGGRETVRRPCLRLRSGRTAAALCSRTPLRWPCSSSAESTRAGQCLALARLAGRLPPTRAPPRRADYRRSKVKCTIMLMPGGASASQLTHHISPSLPLRPRGIRRAGAGPAPLPGNVLGREAVGGQVEGGAGNAVV